MRLGNYISKRISKYISYSINNGGAAGGGPSIPDNAVVDRDGAYILDRDGAYIIADPTPRTS